MLYIYTVCMYVVVNVYSYVHIHILYIFYTVYSYMFYTMQVEDSWKSMEFVVLPHRDSKDVFILGGTDDIQVLLDDSQVNISTIAGSRHVGPIKPRVEEWSKQLALFAETLVSYINGIVIWKCMAEGSNLLFNLNPLL